ncbi:hypothetical protein SpCBS45565_g02999 [Spizellomyces sp. 'palustris']|nr:hypothetical protein SpCBS45565_g02999 [Spizellomyces sp. 'palustris']
MHPLHLVILCAFFLQLFEWLGYGAIASKVWDWYKNIFRKAEVKKINKLKREIIDVQTELGRTSAQDQFARWAKLRRRLDKLKADYETQAKQEASTKTFFELKISWGLRSFIWGAQLLLISIYRSTPMFYLPHDWLGPISPLLALPFAPMGSVSILCWFYACKSAFRRLLTSIA